MSKLEVSPELLEALQRLSSLLESDDPLQKTLDTVAELSVRTLPGCDSAGVTLRSEGNYSTTAATDEFSLKMDRIQYEAGEGPCVEALETAEFRQIQAVSQELRWRDFCRRAQQDGFGSNLSFPLRINGSVGVLNIYAKNERAFDDRTIEIGQIFARQVSIALRNAQMYVAARDLAKQLNEALETRDLIGQAKGILMERESISDEEAFAMLRTISQHANVKLRDIAQRLVEEKVLSSNHSS